VKQPPPPLQGWSLYDETSSSLWTGATALSFPLPASRPLLGPPRPPATSAPGIYTTRDLSPFYRTAMSFSSRMGSSLSSLICITWSEHGGTQTNKGVTKSVEEGLGLSFPSRVLSTSGAKSDPQPRSSRVVLPSQVNWHTGRMRDWRGAMRLDRKSDNTIIDDRPRSAKYLILSITGLKSACSLRVSSQ
jgi:hypothetical protein